MKKNKSFADLHCHSLYSERPAQWILRRLGVPESYSEPLMLYQKAKERGMDFFTITDHNSIEGILELAHLPDVFISEEVTSYFPETECKIHILVFNINEVIHQELQSVRKNIYELRDYLVKNNILHAVAHSFYQINNRLTIEYIEKLIVLFNIFEGLNGGRNYQNNDLLLEILHRLTPEKINILAKKHNIKPIGEIPWKKGIIGGSDDHSGDYIGCTCTVTELSKSKEDFLGNIKNKNSYATGMSGTPLSLAHSIYSVIYQYYKDKFKHATQNQPDLFSSFFRDLFRFEPPLSKGFFPQIHYFTKQIFSSSNKNNQDLENMIKQEIDQIMKQLKAETKDLQREFDLNEINKFNQQTFYLASRITHRLMCQFTQKFLNKLSKGNFLDSLQALSALGPIYLLVLPYIYAFKHQYKDREFLKKISENFLNKNYFKDKKQRRIAWFTDTIFDVNGVSVTIQKMAEASKNLNKELYIVSSVFNDTTLSPFHKNFNPLGEFKIPEYELQRLVFPPFLDMLYYCEQMDFDELIISTPGPVGITALLISKLLRIPTRSIYHTDFPLHIRMITQDDGLEELSWKYIKWFYQQMDYIYVPSKFYQNQLSEKQFDSKKMRLFKKGTDLSFFNPIHRDDQFWKPYGGDSKIKLLYVGRVSREKNLDLLISVFLDLQRKGIPLFLGIVGDGPYLHELKQKYINHGVAFTGFLNGKELVKAYASADLFVFPSTTDTYGNVVLEAQASGLPCIVSDEGGPQEIIKNKKTGLVVKIKDSKSLKNIIKTLCLDKEYRQKMSSEARKWAENFSWETALSNFWEPPESSKNESNN